MTELNRQPEETIVLLQIHAERSMFSSRNWINRALHVLIPELDKYRLSIIIVRPGEVSPMIPLRCAEIITLSYQRAVRLLETLLPHVTLF